MAEIIFGVMVLVFLVWARNQPLLLSLYLPWWHVCVTVNKINIRDMTMVEVSNVSLKRNNTSLMDKTKPNHCKNIESIPDC